MPWAGAALALGALALVRHALTGLPLTATSPLAPVNAVYDLALAGLLTALAWAVGRRVLATGTFAWRSRLEHAVFSIGCGFALLAYATFGLSAARLISPAPFLAVGAIFAVLCRGELRAVARDVRDAAAFVRSLEKGTSEQAQFIVVLLVPIVLMALCVALLPPAGYDALQYHLEVPRRLVAAHRFVSIPDVSQAAMPMTVEMLYTVCLLFGSDSAPALVHLVLAATTGLAIWALADRFFDRRVAWLAVIAFASASEVQRWGPIANADYGPTLYELLAIAAVLIWQRRRERPWLLLAASMAGVSLGMKYTAVPIVGILALLVATADGLSPRRMVRDVAPAILLIAVAATVASPWYIKNAVVYHNPVQPLLIAENVPQALALPGTAAAASPAARPSAASLATAPLRLLTNGSQYALSGRGWLDYLKLPLWTYVRGDFEQPCRPALLFVALPASLLLLRGRPVARRLAFVAALLTLIWSMGSQELRYLLPAFPLYALLSALALVELAHRFLREGAARAVIRVLVVLSVGAGIAEQALFVHVVDPFPVLAGAESRASFLQRVGVHYADLAYLQRVVRPGELTLALGEKRGYYASVPMVLDNSTDNVGAAFVRPGSPEKTAELFERSHIAYVLVAQNDLDWVAQFDTQRLRDGEVAFDRFKARYLTEVFRGDEATAVYRFDPEKAGNP